MTEGPQKILLLDTGREWGGGTNSMLELLKRIDRKRFHVTCCFYHNYLRGEGENIESVLKRINIPVIFIPQKKPPLWAKLLKETLRSLFFFSQTLKKRVVAWIDQQWRIRPNAQKIRALLQQGAFDTLYMNNQPSTNIEGYLAATGLTIGVVQHCRIEPQLDARLVQRVNNDCNAVIAVSHGVNQTLQDHGVAAQRCFTVTNAVDIYQPLPDKTTVREQLGLAEQSFLFGSIGSLIPRKSHHHILQALAQFKQHFPDADWRMVVVGAGPEHDKLLQQARHDKISDHVLFTGFRNNALDYLSAFDVFILASKSEGLPRVVLEAMLVNTAVIGSNVTGTAELIEDNRTGLLFDYGDTSTLFKHMQHLWQDASLRQSLVRQANAHVKAHYAIENYVAQVETIVHNVNRGKQPHV